MTSKRKRKLTKNEESSIKSGLIIGNAIKITYNKNSSTNVLLLLIITLCGLIGTIISFITLFSIPVDTSQILMYTVLFFAIFSVISILPDKSLFAIFPLTILYIYILQDYMEEFITGFKVVANSIATEVFEAGVWTKYYQVPSGIIESEYATLFLVFCIFLLTGLMCLFTIKGQYYIMGFVLTFPFIECGIYFGAVPNYVAFFMVVCYWIAILSMALSGSAKSTRNKSAGFVRVGNSFFAKSDCNFRVSEKIGISSMVMCLVCALLSFGLVNASGYERSQNLNEFRTEIKDSVENFDFSNVPYLFARLGNMLSSGNSSSFSGTLGQKDSVEFQHVDVYNITTTDTPKDDIYLKSYVGSKYTGNSWDTLNDKVYSTPLFDTFKSNNIYPQDLLGLQSSSSNDTFQMTISGVSKSNNASLIPYATYSNDNLTAVKDTTFKFNSKSDRTLNVVNIVSKNVISSSSYSQPSNFDSTSYEDFVKEYYLQLGDDESMEEIKDIFQSYLDTYNLDFDTFNSKADVPTKLDYIKNFLCSSYEYTLSPGKTPLDEDFVLYFLKTGKKGYCSHFASAGTILCRMLDIPARYVEGYYVDMNNFDSSAYDGSTYNVTIKDDCGHAWAEVYMENIGWVNYDFTPGFNGNPTMEDFSNAEDSEDSNEEDSTEPVETETQPVETQVVDVTETSTEVSNVTTEITTSTQPEEETEIEHKPLISEKTLKTLKHIFAVILTCAIIVGLIILRRKYIVQQRTENISSKNTKKSVLASYRYIMQTLKYLGFERKESMPYMKFAKEVSSNLNTLDTNTTFTKIMDLVLKAELSDANISQEEKTIVSEFAYALANNTYDSKSKWEKLFVKYILCLV